MKKIFGMDESKVKIFPKDHIKEAEKHFYEGWCKGTMVNAIAFLAGYGLMSLITDLRNKRES